jgi:transposase
VRCGWCAIISHEYPSQWKAIESISEKLSVNHETSRQWIRRAEVDGGQRPGVTTDEKARRRELGRENRELRQANEMAETPSSPPRSWTASSTAPP